MSDEKPQLYQATIGFKNGTTLDFVCEGRPSLLRLDADEILWVTVKRHS